MRDTIFQSNTLHQVWVYSRNKETILLTVLMLGGAFLRFLFLPSTSWSGDAARDLLVSQHIILYREYPNIGHVASGTNPIFYYPPLYYYLLAFIQLVSTNTWYVLCIFVILNIISIGVFFLIGKLLTNSSVALAATALYTFSTFYLDRQTTLSSMHFTLPFFLTGTFFHLLGLRSHKSLPVFIGLSFIVLSALINYAALILIPVYIFWTMIVFRKNLEKPLLYLSITYGLFLVLIYPFARYIVTTYNWMTLIRPFLPENNIVISSDLLGNSFNQFRVVLFTGFPFYSSVLIIIFPFLLGIAMYKRKSFDNLSLLYPVSLLSVTILLSAVKNKPADSYYYYLVIPFMYLLSALYIGIPYKSKLQRIISLGLFILIFLSATGNINQLLDRKQSYRQIEITTDSVIQELTDIKKQHKYPKYDFMKIIALNQTNSDWEGLRYSFFLEKKLGKMFRVYDHYNNLEWVNRDDYLILICLIDKSTKSEWCKKRFSVLYPNHVFVKPIVTNLEFPILVYRKKSIPPGR